MSWKGIKSHWKSDFDSNNLFLMQNNEFSHKMEDLMISLCNTMANAIQDTQDNP